MAGIKRTEDEEQVVVFELASESYGVDISRVREIIRPPAITAVPRAAWHIEGVINLRGRVIPVVNLRRRFGLPEAARERASRIVVVEVSGHIVGMAVDAVSEVLHIPSGAVEAPGATLASAETSHLRGIAKLNDSLVILLDLDRVIEATGAGRTAA